MWFHFHFQQAHLFLERLPQDISWQFEPIALSFFLMLEIVLNSYSSWQKCFTLNDPEINQKSDIKIIFLAVSKWCRAESWQLMFYKLPLAKDVTVSLRQQTVNVSIWIYTSHRALCHRGAVLRAASMTPAATQSDGECAAAQPTSKLSHRIEWNEMWGNKVLASSSMDAAHLQCVTDAIATAASTWLGDEWQVSDGTQG